MTKHTYTHTTKQSQFLALAAIVEAHEKHLADRYYWRVERELDDLCIKALAAGASLAQVADARGNDITRQTVRNRYS